MDGHKQGVVRRVVNPAQVVVVYGQPGMARGADTVLPRRLVRPCVPALGASYHTFCRPASVADDALVERPPYLPGGDGAERAPRLFYLLFKTISRLHNLDNSD